MAQEISKPTNLPVRESFPKTTAFFDCAELIVERTGTLLGKGEATLVKLFLVFHLILDLLIVAWFLLSKVA